MPDITVIVPTHNRASLLAKHLGALEVQTFPRLATEWIVVCDGCHDDSASVARGAGADRVIELGEGSRRRPERRDGRRNRPPRGLS